MRPISLTFLLLGWAAAGWAQSPGEAFRVAAESYQKQDWQGSSEQFSRLIAAHPADPLVREAWFYLGEAQVQLGDWEAARVAYGNFLLLVPVHPYREKARFRLLELACLRGDVEASQLCEGFLKAYPSSHWRPEVLKFLGQTRLQRGEFELAERVFETGLEEGADGPEADEIRLGLATAKLRLGQLQPAAEVLREIESRRNDGLGQRARVLSALVDIERGEQALATEKLKGVLASQALPPQPEAEVLVWLGRLEAQAGNPNAARQYYWSALESELEEPWLSTALSEWAALRLQASPPTGAASELAALKEKLAPGKINRVNRELWLALEVRFHYEVGDWAQAALAAQTYRVSHPAGASYRQVTEIAGRAAYAQGNYAEAIACFEELLQSPGLAPADAANYRYQLACQLVAQQNYKEANDLLMTLELGQLASETALQAERLRATALEGAGQPTAALQLLERLAAESLEGRASGSFSVVRQLLMLALKQESYATIQAWWPSYTSAWRERSPALIEAHDATLVQRVGDLAYRNEDWALATDCYRQLADVPNDLTIQAAGWSGLAWTALAEARPTAAREAFETLLEMPVSEEFKAEAYLPLANLLEDAGDLTTAVSMYNRAANQTDQPSVAAVARFKGAAALRALGGENSLAEARDWLDRLSRDPHPAVPADQVAYHLAWVESELGRLEDAEQRFTTFLSQYVDSPLWPDAAFRVARGLWQRGDWDGAEKLISQAEKLTLPVELQERLRFLAGQVSASRGSWEEVIGAMAPLAEAGSDGELRERATYWLAEAQFQAGRYAESLHSWNQLLERADTTLDPSQWQAALLRQVESTMALEDWEAALARMEGIQGLVGAGAASKELTPANRAQLGLLTGRAAVALGKLGAAEQAFQEVLAISPAGSELAAQAQWRIGELKLLQERYEEALEAYSQTVSKYDYPHWQAAAMFQAGKCQERLGNQRHALKLYQELMQRYPESEFAESARRRVDVLERRARSEELIRR